MRISALILATNRAPRLELLRQAVSYLDAQAFPFVEKLLVIDRVCDVRIPDPLLFRLRDAGWTVLIEGLGSKVQCLLKALALATGDVVYYNEDDIQARLPNLVDLEAAWNYPVDPPRVCGMVSMTLGGSTHSFPEGQCGDLDRAEANTFYKTPSYQFFRRDEQKRSEYFVEFPGLFIRKELFVSCLNPGIANHDIERALTRAWFERGFDARFWKASVCKLNIAAVIETARTHYYREVLETAKLQRLLDPWQGGIYFDLSRVPPLEEL